MDRNAFRIAVTANLKSWRLIVNDVLLVFLMLGAYFIYSMLLRDLNGSEPSWVHSFEAPLYWTAVIVSGVSVVRASVKSVLPATLALVLIIPLYLLGYVLAAKIVLLSAVVMLVLYAIGFVFHGGRNNLSVKS